MSDRLNTGHLEQRDGLVEALRRLDIGRREISAVTSTLNSQQRTGVQAVAGQVLSAIAAYRRVLEGELGSMQYIVSQHEQRAAAKEDGDG